MKNNKLNKLICILLICVFTYVANSAYLFLDAEGKTTQIANFMNKCYISLVMYGSLFYGNPAGDPIVFADDVKMAAGKTFTGDVIGNAATVTKGVYTDSENVISAGHLKGTGSAKLANGSAGNLLKSLGDGTFDWDTTTYLSTPAITNIGNGTAQYQLPVTGADPYTPAWTAATGTGSPVLATSPTVTGIKSDAYDTSTAAGAYKINNINKLWLGAGNYDENLFLGNGGASISSADGKYNVSAGPGALLSLATGTQNTAVGYLCLDANTSGGYNVGVGQSALGSNIDGSYNCALGVAAGSYYGSGSGANTTSENSIYIGASARAGADGNTNETVLGYYAVGNGSNTVTLGNDSVTKTILKGSVGIGTTSPATYAHSYGDDLVIYKSDFSGITLATGTSGYGSVFFSDQSSGSDTTASYEGALQYGHTENALDLYAGHTAILELRAAYMTSVPTVSKTTASAANMYIHTDGVIYKSTSSEKYKENIRPLDKPSSLLLDLTGKKYDSKCDTGGEYIGLIAEEVAKAIPECATYSRLCDMEGLEDDLDEYGKCKIDKKGTVKKRYKNPSIEVVPSGIEWNAIATLLVEENKRQQKLIDDLTERIEKLETKIKGIE